VTEARILGPGFDRVVRSSDPNWKIKIAKKQNASQSYSRSFLKGSFTTGVVRGQSTVVPYNEYYNAYRYAGNVPSSFPSTDTATDDIALKRIKNKISSHEAHFNSLLPLAELRELRITISGAAELTSDFLRTAVDIKRSKGRSAAKYLSKAWLTYGFGIAPVVSDVAKLADSIKEFLLRNDHTAVLKGSYEKQWVTGGKLSNVNVMALTGSDMFETYHHQHKLSYQYKGGFNFLLRSASDYGASAHFGFQMQNLVPTAWELVPFSWVVDYFGTVGDWLDDTFTGTPVKLLYLNRTRKYECRGFNENYTVPRPNALKNFKEIRRGTCNFVYSEFERTVLATLPHRVLRFRTVDEVAQHSLNKLFNLFSILGSDIRTPRR